MAEARRTRRRSAKRAAWVLGAAFGLASVSGGESVAEARPVVIGVYQELPFGVARSHPSVTEGVRSARDGRSTARAPARQPSVRFTARVGEAQVGAPVVMTSGSLLGVAADRAVHVTATGTLLPEPASLRGASGVSLTPGGGYVVAESDGLAWLDAALTLGARFPIPGLAQVAPLVLEDGSAVVTAGARVLRVDVQGRERFSVPVASRTHSAVARTPLGTLVAATTSDLLVLDEGGRVLRREALPELPVAGPAVALDGTIWMLTQHAIVAFDADGSIRRRVPAPTTSRLTHGGLAIAADGSVRVASLGLGVVGLNPAGDTLFTVELPLARFVMVDAVGVALVLTQDGVLVALEPGGAERWRVSLGGAPHAPPVLGADGSVFVGMRSGDLIALQ